MFLCEKSCNSLQILPPPYTDMGHGLVLLGNLSRFQPCFFWEVVKKKKKNLVKMHTKEGESYV